MHLLPEDIPNCATPSGSRSEEPAFLSALHASVVILLSFSQHGSVLAASSIFSFIKFTLTSVAEKPSGGSARITSSCPKRLLIACILLPRFHEVFIREHTWWAHSLQSVLARQKHLWPVSEMFAMKCWSVSFNTANIVCNSRGFFQYMLLVEHGHKRAICLCQTLNSVLCPSYRRRSRAGVVRPKLCISRYGWQE